ncbi:hypothetical protein A0J61_11241 [Choanephora cucurbitarum]|uniref:CCHC-type domain-containing protein n=1 Tax=Choanephora cucurbitarum TaxID=101091 RepID=A0A1C7MV59_9FUNG|nr:hypothetical protein A0J61_11241 [Choanephora cucurbitarum]
MDIKLAIPIMTDEEATDKFVRGLMQKGMRAHVRQYEANTLKDAIHSALSYDKDDFQDKRQPSRNRSDDPMDLDVIDHRRNPQGYSFRRNNRFNDNRNNRFNNNNNNNNECFYCHRPGHLKRNCRIRLADIKKLDDQHSKKQRKDF